MPVTQVVWDAVPELLSILVRMHGEGEQLNNVPSPGLLGVGTNYQRCIKACYPYTTLHVWAIIAAAGVASVT
jgi:hypothetical protein